MYVVYVMYVCYAYILFVYAVMCAIYVCVFVCDIYIDMDMRMCVYCPSNVFCFGIFFSFFFLCNISTQIPHFVRMPNTHRLYPPTLHSFCPLPGNGKNLPLSPCHGFLSASKQLLKFLLADLFLFHQKTAAGMKDALMLLSLIHI